MNNDSTEFICSEFAVPKNFKPADLKGGKALPRSWSKEKRKIFHAIRQLYGQMVSSKRKYGLFHTYERWWFCYRTSHNGGTLFVSDPFKGRHNGTGPSVCQALKTLIGLGDHHLIAAGHHLKSPAIESKKRKERDDSSDEESDCEKKYTPVKSTAQPNQKSMKSSSRTRATSTSRASDILLEDCELLDTTDDVKIFSVRDDPRILVKLLRPRSRARSEEFQNEADMYAKMWKRRYKDILGDTTIPVYFGNSEHLGTPLVCLGREGKTFGDIGIDDLSKELKLSAVDAMRKLSTAGVLHQDIALRNIVQCRVNPACAKIIDFGRSILTDDQSLLHDQIIELKQLLQLIP